MEVRVFSLLKLRSTDKEVDVKLKTADLLFLLNVGGTSKLLVIAGAQFQTLGGKLKQEGLWYACIVLLFLFNCMKFLLSASGVSIDKINKGIHLSL